MDISTLARAGTWEKTIALSPREYICGYCDNHVASSTGYVAQRGSKSEIYICPFCNYPTIFLSKRGSNKDMQIPGLLPGVTVENVPEDIGSLYSEARACVAAGAFTASVLMCRKMLMDLAVAQGAEYKRGKRFIEYVEYLAKTIFVPPHGVDWLEKIREQGNKATHELGSMAKDDAVLLIRFIEMLLRMLYEFPALVGRETSPSEQSRQHPSPGPGPDPRPAGR